MTTFICIDCGGRLTEEEQHYYSCRCEDCVTEWSDRITAWRKGGADPELDRAYSAVPMETH